MIALELISLSKSTESELKPHELNALMSSAAMHEGGVASTRS